MTIFADFHHTDLYHSLRMLFSHRLGWKIYRPVGFNWYKKGFWKYTDKWPTIKQYLNITNEYFYTGDYWSIFEVHNNATEKCLTFEQFKKKKIDLIIASVAQHEEPYNRLIKKYKPKAKLIRQQGNIHDTIDFDIVKNVLASCAPYNPPKDVSAVFYHQEFDLDVFKYQPSKLNNLISNFMNCLPASRDYYLWPVYKQELPDFDFRMYGILGEDGILATTEEIAQKMSDSTFIWHIKAGGDGFGHVIHNAFACGRPLITKISHYKDTLAEPLLEDGKTCIDIENKGFMQVIKQIRFFSQPKEHQKMCENVHNRFKRFIDFDHEFTYIQKFLKHLK